MGAPIKYPLVVSGPKITLRAILPSCRGRVVPLHFAKTSESCGMNPFLLDLPVQDPVFAMLVVQNCCDEMAAF